MKIKSIETRQHQPQAVTGPARQHPIRLSGGPGIWGIGLLLLWLSLVAGSSPVRAQKVVAWGSKFYAETTVPAGLSGVVAISAGNGHSLALKSDGTVSAWGNNSRGQTTVPDGLAGLVAIAAGSWHSLALKSDGTVVAWGSNSNGEINVPAGLSGVVAIAAVGNTQSLALKSDGTVVAWGSTGTHELNVPASLSGVVAIAAGGNDSMALKSDGTVVAWGFNSNGQSNVPVNLSHVVAIAAGYDHSLALKSDGTVVAWGANHYGQRTVPTGLSGVVAIAAGSAYSMALKADGTVVAWGINSLGQITVPAGLSGVVAIAAGDEHAMALVRIPNQAPTILSPRAAVATKDSGSFYYPIVTTNPATSFAAEGLPEGLTLDPATGLITGTPAAAGRFTVTLTATNPFGSKQLAMIVTVTGPLLYTGTTLSPIWTIGLPVPGRLYATGQPRYSATGLPPGTWMDPDSGAILGIPNQFGQYHVSFTFTTSTATASHGMEIAVTNVTTWGEYHEGILNFPYDLGGVMALAAGSSHSLALKADGTVATWSINPSHAWPEWDSYSQAIAVPPGLTDVVAIASGNGFCMALKRNGTVVAWGRNLSGQTAVPADLSGVVAIAAGGDESMALKDDGTVVAWGDNTSGQNNVPAGLSGVVAIAAGSGHSLALKADGTVVAWGDNSSGQSTVPAGLSDVVSIAASNYSLALRRDGTLVAWGDIYEGTTRTPVRLPAGLSDVVAISAGNLTSLALKRDGTVVDWTNWNNQAGYDGSFLDALRRPSLSGVAAISTKWNFSHGLIGPVITSPPTASVRISQPFSHTVTSLPDVVFSANSLPDGLILNPVTGVLSGAVATAGRYDIRITARHSVTGLSLSQAFRLYVMDADFAAWQARQFGSPVPPDARPDADPDADGMANLFEYARGTNPLVQDPESVSTPAQGSAGARDLYLEVLAPAAAELTGRAQFADTPSFLSPAEVSTPTSIETLTNGYQRVTFTDPAPGPSARRFGRLLISLHP